MLEDEDSSFLTTFETPFGKYRWLRMPFGVSPAPEEFQRRIDVALHGLQSVVAVHDYIIVWGKGSTDQEASEDHDNNLRKLLQRCREVNLKLNREKVELKQTSRQSRCSETVRNGWVSAEICAQLLHRCENSSRNISTFEGTNTYMAKC